MVARVAVIGAGGMGSWFARFFKSRGDSVIISDIDRRKAKVLASRTRAKFTSSNLEAARGSDVVILAVPARAISRVTKEILPVLQGGTLLCDISAVKSAMLPTLRSAERRGIKVASIHPMFGPLASGLRGRRIVAVRIGKDKGGYRMMKHILEGASVILTDPRVHDRRMAVTLGLPHFLNMAFLMVVCKRRNLPEIKEFAGRTFNLQMLLAEVVASEPETAADIQIMNKEFRPVLRELQREIRALAKIVNRKDRTQLVTRYKQVSKLLSADPEFRNARRAFEKVSEAYSAAPRSQRQDVRPYRGR